MYHLVTNTTTYANEMSIVRNHMKPTNQLLFKSNI